MLGDGQAIRSAFSENNQKFLVCFKQQLPPSNNLQLSKPLVDALMKHQHTLTYDKTLTTPNYYFWKWITGELDAAPLGVHNAGRASILSVVIAYRVLETANMVYGSSFIRRVPISRDQPEDVIKLVDSVKKLVSKALRVVIFKRTCIICPIDTTKWGGSELGGIPPTSKSKRRHDLGQGGPGYRRE